MLETPQLKELVERKMMEQTVIADILTAN